ncbi:MAG: hypothetical protein AAFP00_15600, partial [Bacteroidota bacterium]
SFYDQEAGSCMKCGDEQSNLCPASVEARPFQFCELSRGSEACSSGYTCSRTFANGTLTTLPDGSTLQDGVGFCIPEGGTNDCMYNWFNINAGPTGATENLGAGYCSPETPYCTTSGEATRCQAVPQGALCAEIAGYTNSNEGSFDRGNTNQYNMTGICDGALLPPGSFAAPAGFGVTGNPLPGLPTQFYTQQCRDVGSANPSGTNCGCQPSENDPNSQSNPGCPLGSYCQRIGAVGTAGPQMASDIGICMIARGSTGATGAAGTFSNAPLNGTLGHLYSNYTCAPNSQVGGAYTCQPYPSNANEFNQIIGQLSSTAVPGAPCYTNADCSLNYGQNSVQNTDFGTLTCQNGRCYGLNPGS